MQQTKIRYEGDQVYRVVGQLVTLQEPHRMAPIQVYSTVNNHGVTAYREYISAPRIVMTYTGKHRPQAVRVCKGTKLGKVEGYTPVDEPVEYKRARILAKLAELRKEVRSRAVDIVRQREDRAHSIVINCVRKMEKKTKVHHHQYVVNRANQLHVPVKYIKADQVLKKYGIITISL